MIDPGPGDAGFLLCSLSFADIPPLTAVGVKRIAARHVPTGAVRRIHTVVAGAKWSEATEAGSSAF